MNDVKVRLIIFLLLLIFTNLCIAQSLYISDKIPIPIYSAQDTKSKPIKTLPSGTMVTIVPATALPGDPTQSTQPANKKLTQIETKDGVVGWIEAIYLTNEKPTQIEYLSLASKHKAAEAKIKDYETRLLDMQELRKEAKTTDWLRNQLNENKKKEAAYEQKIKQKDIALADLRITIAGLEEKLRNQNPGLAADTSKNIAGGSQATANLEQNPASEFYANSTSIRFYTWLVLSLAVTLIIGILLGFVLIDYKSRKKVGNISTMY